mgnify:CR=1 FL=1
MKRNPVFIKLEDKRGLIKKIELNRLTDKDCTFYYILRTRLCRRTVVPAGREGERAGPPGPGHSAPRRGIVAGQVVFIVPLQIRIL